MKLFGSAPRALVMDANASVPLPESVARQLNPFHRLMRSYKLGAVGLVLVAFSLAFEPMVTVAPLLLIVSWFGAVEVRNMQRFFDLATGWYMAIVMVRVRVAGVCTYVLAPDLVMCCLCTYPMTWACACTCMGAGVLQSSTLSFYLL